MDPLTINSATFILMNGTTAVTGIVTYSGVTATFTPSVNLAYNTAYTATSPSPPASRTWPAMPLASD